MSKCQNNGIIRIKEYPVTNNSGVYIFSPCPSNRVYTGTIFFTVSTNFSVNINGANCGSYNSNNFGEFQLFGGETLTVTDNNNIANQQIVFIGLSTPSTNIPNFTGNYNNSNPAPPLAYTFSNLECVAETITSTVQSVFDVSYFKNPPTPGGPFSIVNVNVMFNGWVATGSEGATLPEVTTVFYFYNGHDINFYTTVVTGFGEINFSNPLIVMDSISAPMLIKAITTYLPTDSFNIVHNVNYILP